MPDTTLDPDARSYTAPLRHSLNLGNDVEIVVFGDSTTTGGGPWPRRLGRWLGVRWGHTVKYALWSSGWGSTSTIYSGASAEAMIWNAGVAGFDADDITDNFAAMSAPVTSADLVIVNMGHNVFGTDEEQEASYQAMVDAITAEWPTALVLLIAQNRGVVAAGNTTRRTWIQSIAAAESFAVVDLWDQFGGDSPRTQWMEDNTHPNGVGYSIVADRLIAATVS